MTRTFFENRIPATSFSRLIRTEDRSGCGGRKRGIGTKAPFHGLGRPSPGIIQCGVCGGGFILVNKHRYVCAIVRDRGTCDTHLTVRHDRLEDAVLDSVGTAFLIPIWSLNSLASISASESAKSAIRQRQDA